MINMQIKIYMKTIGRTITWPCDEATSEIRSMCVFMWQYVCYSNLAANFYWFFSQFVSNSWYLFCELRQKPECSLFILASFLAHFLNSEFAACGYFGQEKIGRRKDVLLTERMMISAKKIFSIDSSAFRKV